MPVPVHCVRLFDSTGLKINTSPSTPHPKHPTHNPQPQTPNPTSRLISLAGVKWSCLRISKPAPPPYHAGAAERGLLQGRSAVRGANGPRTLSVRGGGTHSNHSTLNTQHSTLNTQHSTLNTQHSTLDTQPQHQLPNPPYPAQPRFPPKQSVGSR